MRVFATMLYLRIASYSYPLHLLLAGLLSSKPVVVLPLSNCQIESFRRYEKVVTVPGAFSCWNILVRPLVRFWNPGSVILGPHRSPVVFI